MEGGQEKSEGGSGLGTRLDGLGLVLSTSPQLGLDWKEAERRRVCFRPDEKPSCGWFLPSSGEDG